MQRNKVLAYLGLATRAGKSVSGEFSVVSEDASENSKKNFRNICTYYGVPLYFLGSREELGLACGKEVRVSAAIEDEGLARAAVGKLKQESGIGGSKYVE